MLAAQLESASLALQNLRLDLLKLRSSGLGSAMSDVASATQEAKALSRDIGHAVDAVREVKGLSCAPAGVMRSPLRQSPAYPGTDASPRTFSRITLVAPVRSPARRRDTARVPLVPRPAVVRGLYVNRWAAIGQKMWELIDVAKRTEVNALVLDVKDDRGYLLYRSSVPLARAIGADKFNPMPRRAHARACSTRCARTASIPSRASSWPRIRCSPTRSASGRCSAARTASPGSTRTATRGSIRTIAGVGVRRRSRGRRRCGSGFSEVQFDYVRFPDERRMLREARFPLAKGRRRDEVIREQLGYLRTRLAPLGAPMAIDVFGATTTIDNDMGIGQTWERFADQADVVLPMTYPSHYPRGSYGIAHPNAEPYAVLDHALRGARVRNRGVENAGRSRALVPGLHAGQAEVRRGAAPRADAGRLRQRDVRLDAVESRQPLHGEALRPAILRRARNRRSGSRAWRATRWRSRRDRAAQGARQGATRHAGAAPPR